MELAEQSLRVGPPEKGEHFQQNDKMTAYVRLFIRASLAIACILVIIPVMLITWNLGMRKATRAVMQSAFIFAAWAWNMRVRTEGILAQRRPLMLVSNHFSYLDLLALGSVAPAAFIAKSEIASWPVLGLMCKAAGCLFIDRKTSRTLQNKKLLDAAVKFGDIIGLFPEGTTDDGTELLPFKTSLFSIAEHKDMEVQPVSIMYTALNGEAIDTQGRNLVGWYGGADFLPHVMRFLQQKSVDVTIVFHTHLNGKDFASRKELSQRCYHVIQVALYHEEQ
jgi:1-acyl-sn-glycerol-3-phosphate acyltransferase